MTLYEANLGVEKVVEAYNGIAKKSIGCGRLLVVSSDRVSRLSGVLEALL